MKSAVAKRRAPALVTVLTIVAIFIGGFFWFYNKTGGHLAGTDKGYEVSFMSQDVKNLQPGGEVRMAGVTVGSVSTQMIGPESAKVTVHLDRDVAPLHDGLTFRVGMKSLVGQSYVDLVDGDGAVIAERSVVPKESVIPAVEIDELLGTFDAPTRGKIESLLSSLGPSAEGTQEEVAQLMTGLGAIGSDGATVTSAIAAQNQDLRRLVVEANTLLAALDTNRGQIAGMVENARTLVGATAGQKEALEQTVRALPPLMTNARVATASVDELATDLEPIAKPLRAAAPDLSTALRQLPETTAQLRSMLPALDRTLTRAPATLTRVPTLDNDVRALVPGLRGVLADANPMLGYLQPYAYDIGSFFGNFGATFDRPVENGVRPVSLAPIFNEYSVRGIPLNLQTINPLHWNDPYPAPMTADEPNPFRGDYPHVERAE